MFQNFKLRPKRARNGVRFVIQPHSAVVPTPATKMQGPLPPVSSVSLPLRLPVQNTQRAGWQLGRAARPGRGGPTAGRDVSAETTAPQD